jgi:hypothetical protein
VKWKGLENFDFIVFIGDTDYGLPPDGNEF